MQKIIVALTSYPNRIQIVHNVIHSLWQQKRCADEIVLYLSSMEFPNKEENLPKELLEMMGKNGFRIEWVKGNLKSHKKYYNALRQYGNDIVITVDDDIEYADTLIYDLMESYERFPHAISARRARIMLKKADSLEVYHEWDSYVGQYAASPRMDLCAIGAGGILYPPHSATSTWFDRDKIVQLAENQDDLWLKYQELLNGIPVVYWEPTQKDQPIESAKESALTVKNVQQGENDSCIERISEDMKQNHSVLFHNWISSLLPKEEFVLEKKNYYFSKIRKQFEDRKDKPIYLYGAGKVAKQILRILNDGELLFGIEAILVSDKQNNPNELFGIKVRLVEEPDKTKPFYVIYGVGIAYQPEVEKLLQDYPCRRLQLDIAGLVRYYEK